MDQESILRKKGTKRIAGVDEAGRGPLAGPVVAAAVILKDDARIRKLRDSKAANKKSRDILYTQIISNAVSIGIAIVDNRTIDRKNILRTSLYAMKNAVDLLDIEPRHVLVDGRDEVPGISMEQTAVIGGDKTCRSVTCASIIAKVVRDGIMEHYGRLYPNYRFNEHKGYGTKLHMKLLRRHGPISIHRLSYSPVFKALTSQGVIFI